MNRRAFFKWSVRAAVGVPLAATGYGLFEASWFRVARQTLTVRHLPPAFEGLTIAFLADLHHSRYTSLRYIRTVVEATNSLGADIILLGGDYAFAGKQYLEPCFEVLAELQAPLGKFGVMGNHDHWYSRQITRTAMAKAGVAELTNTGYWFTRDGQRLRIGGVDDLWTGVQNLPAALGDASITDATILLSHNPDYVETLTDPRVGLVLSGHTHGGQVVFPGLYAPFVPSRYGMKYLHGLVETPVTQVYVSRGLATTGPPIRIGARPEISLLTLTAG